MQQSRTYLLPVQFILRNELFFRFIHDVALRKTMLKAHLQAWIWQDEWHGLTMEVGKGKKYKNFDSFWTFFGKENALLGGIRFPRMLCIRSKG